MKNAILKIRWINISLLHFCLSCVLSSASLTFSFPVWFISSLPALISYTDFFFYLSLFSISCCFLFITFVFRAFLFLKKKTTFFPLIQFLMCSFPDFLSKSIPSFLSSCSVMQRFRFLLKFSYFPLLFFNFVILLILQFNFFLFFFLLKPFKFFVSLQHLSFCFSHFPSFKSCWIQEWHLTVSF